MPVINQLWPAGPADTRMHNRPARPTAFRRNQKYPRVCGEKASRWWLLSTPPGSPPRMRGKGRFSHVGDLLQGITPASAGKRHKADVRRWQAQDHPRICREKAEMGGFIPRFSGSPPRMRGKEAQHFAGAAAPGITPAYAGKSFRVSVKPCFRGDHPRICGEKKRPILTFRRLVGSPPHMRGKGRAFASFRCLPGITPAYAGKRNCNLEP